MSVSTESPLAELGTAEDSVCRDPECGGIAEVEVDGDHRYLVCNDCGFEFGYERVQLPTIGGDDSCAISVPESIRRSASMGFEGAMAAEAAAQPVPITLSLPPKG